MDCIQMAGSVSPDHEQVADDGHAAVQSRRCRLIAYILTSS